MDDTTARIIYEDMIIMIENGVRDIRRANNKLFNEQIDREKLEGDNTISTGFGFFPQTMSANEAQTKYREAGYEVTVYPCFPDMPAFKNYFSTDTPVARELGNNLVILPLHEYLQEKDLEKLIEVANKI
jgi:dTDP-4-amino-4,6-dideoxygalactose transaminase